MHTHVRAHTCTLLREGNEPEPELGTWQTIFFLIPTAVLYKSLALSADKATRVQRGGAELKPG